MPSKPATPKPSRPVTPPRSSGYVPSESGAGEEDPGASADLVPEPHAPDGAAAVLPDTPADKTHPKPLPPAG